MDEAIELLKLFESENCDYDKCRDLISKIGGCTQIIEGSFGIKTTPLHEAIAGGHYDFALELIEKGGADFDVDPDGWGTVMWGLQYLDAENEEEQEIESEYKLRLMRALVKAGAAPNPKGDGNGEELMYWIRYKLNEGEGNVHLWQMEHFIEAHAYGETERFFEKLKEGAVSSIMVSDWGFLLIDERQCDCDHLIFVFDDGERISLSSYQVEDDEWDFYAVPVREDIALDPAKHHYIIPAFDSIKYMSLYTDDDLPSSHWLDLYIDDAILRIHPDQQTMMVGVVGFDLEDHKYRKRKHLFDDIK